MRAPRPLWRWWLFGLAFWLSHHTRWRWPVHLMVWCVRPAWLGRGADDPIEAGEVPW